MSKKTTYLLGILLTIGLGTLLYHYFCCSKNCCENGEMNATTPTIAATAETTTKSNFALKGKDIDYHCSGDFNFLSNDFKSILPINDSINLGIGNLKTLFDKGGKNLTITGYALSSEKNNSAFENLGMARANDVKNYFVSKGIPATSIDIKGEVKDDLLKDETTVYGSVRYLISEITADTPKEDFAALKAKINANPLILYFNTGQASIDLSVEDRKKVTDITHYLDNVADAKLDVVGHTDNVGDRTVNTKLGLGRADFAKNYLVSNGIDTNKIDSSSKGPDQPIADNKTAEGKAKNRRTEVKIK